MFNYNEKANTMSKDVKLTSEGKLYEFELEVSFESVSDEQLKAYAFKEFKTRKFQDASRVNETDLSNTDKNPERINAKRSALKDFENEQAETGKIIVKMSDYPLGERASRKVLSLDEHVEKAPELEQRKALKRLLIVQCNTGVLTEDQLNAQLSMLKLDEIVL